MQLTRVQCRSFRALSEITFEPAPGINIIYGANAQGKTSVLEAILYAATTRSHRTTTDADLARHGGDAFHVSASASGLRGNVCIEAHWWQGAKRFKVDGLAQTRLSDILGRIYVVFFCPEDIGLIKGAAAGRRHFLDMELSQVKPGYLRALQQYRQALRQRNELLKRQTCDGDMLGIWEAQLADQGAVLMTERAAFIQELSDIVAPLYAQIVADEPIALTYCPDVPGPEALASVLERSRKSDLLRKGTGRGPHRDEMEVVIAERSARVYGSQGQQKSAALAIKLAELEWLRRHAGEYPVVLLDEALAELDSRRAARLLAAIPEGVQALITTAQPIEMLPKPGQGSVLHRIERGCLEKE